MGVSQPVCIPLICVTALYVIFSSVALTPATHMHARIHFGQPGSAGEENSVGGGQGLFTLSRVSF